MERRNSEDVYAKKHLYIEQISKDVYQSCVKHVLGVRAQRLSCFSLRHRILVLMLEGLVFGFGHVLGSCCVQVCCEQRLENLLAFLIDANLLDLSLHL